jgi:hypothetical protein
VNKNNLFSLLWNALQERLPNIICLILSDLGACLPYLIAVEVEKLSDQKKVQLGKTTDKNTVG